MSELTIEAVGSNDTGTCDCCGHTSRVVWGHASGAGGDAVYYVHWTVGRVLEHGATFDLALGDWGEDSEPKDRVGVRLAFRRGPTGPSFMVVDAAAGPLADHTLVGACLSRSEVVGTELAQMAFAVVDAIWVGDPRIAEVTMPT